MGSATRCWTELGVTIQSAAAVLSFRNNFNTEMFAGGDLLGWICAGSILAEYQWGRLSGLLPTSHVGGSFVSGCYTGEIDGSASNPLAGRMAWSGDSGGYINTVINLGPNVAGQTITLRFRMGSDEAVAAPGVRIDTISITDATCP